MKTIFVLIFFAVFLYSNEVNTAIQSNIVKDKSSITLQWLKQKPRTITKDFYIWQYLQNNITPNEALEAISQVKNMNNKIFFAFAKKFNHDETYAVAQCMKAKTKALVNQPVDCIKVGLSIYDATKLPYEDLDFIYEKVKKTYPKYAKKLKIINSTIPFTKLVSTPNDIFFGVFNECGSKFRAKHFNYPISKRTLKRVAKDKRFEKSIARIVLNKDLFNMQESILNIDDKKYSSQTSFYLALNAIIHKKFELALKYLNNSYKKAYYRFEKDKIRFWQYQISKEDKYLDDLLNSSDINIYSLLIKEQNSKPLQNIFYNIDLSSNNTTTNFDINDPFNFVKLIKQTKHGISMQQYLDYENIFNTKQTLPFLAYVKSIYEKYTNSYFITPYEEQFNSYDINTKALIYAIARQESRFIPSSISSVYALGVMQIMPFLGKELATRLGEKYNIFNLLDTNTSLRYAKLHLDSLKSRLKHPLYIAYAYNAGEGFVNKQIFRKKLFKDGSFEPFLSMELIPYKETRKYANKVLANYYIYYNYLNKDKQISLTNLLQNTILPFPN
jgi:soluble lytic murein transglycosylase